MQTQALNLNFKQNLLDSRFELLSVIGRGRNSVVYKAKLTDFSNSQSINALVAVKLVNEDSKDIVQGEQRIRHEACSLLACRHKNVIALRDFVANSEVSYLVMDYAPDGDLKQILDRSQRLDLNVALNYSIQLLEGLEAIHKGGVLHRDIKPENLLINNGVVKIADFGIACLATESISSENANRGIGTFDYLAPEVLEEGISSYATDIYAASVTLYQLIVGQVPFIGSTFTEQINNKIKGKRASISQLLQKDLPVLESILTKALHAKIECRYSSALELKTALVEYQKNGESSEFAIVESNRKRVVDREEESLEKINPSKVISDNNLSRGKNDNTSEKNKLDLKSNLFAEMITSNSFAREMEKDIFNDHGSSISKLENPQSSIGKVKDLAEKIITKTRAPSLFVACLVIIGIFYVYLGRDASPDLKKQFNVESSKDATSVSLPEFFSTPRAGKIDNAFGEKKPINLVVSPLNNEDLIVVVGLSGMTPVIVSKNKFVEGNKIYLSSNGLKFELALTKNSVIDGKLIGEFYDEGSNISQRFTLW